MKTFTVIDGASVERIVGVQPTLDHLWATFKKTGRLRTLQVSWQDGDEERVVRGDRFFGLVNGEKDLDRAAGMELIHVPADGLLAKLDAVVADEVEHLPGDVQAVVTKNLYKAFRSLLIAVMRDEEIVFAKKERAW